MSRSPITVGPRELLSPLGFHHDHDAYTTGARGTKVTIAAWNPAVPTSFGTCARHIRSAQPRGTTVTTVLRRMTVPLPAPGSASRSRREEAGVPRVRVTAAVRAHIAADEATLATFRRLRKPPGDDDLDRIVEEVDLARDHFARAGWLDDPGSYHRAPEPLTQPELRPSRAAQLRVERMKFSSGWAPPADVPGRERWLSYQANTLGRATVLRHRDESRPWVVCIHGTGMGRDADLRSFRARHLFEDLGCNVVLPILPLHGPRREPKRSTAQFPSIDPLDNVHGLAQAAHDVRRILGWIRMQSPSAIAVQGVSLGGYVAALVAGLAEPLDCVIAIIPATDFPTLFRSQTPPRMTRRLTPILEPATALHRVVSPLEFAPSTARGASLHRRGARRPTHRSRRSGRPALAPLGPTRHPLVSRRSHRLHRPPRRSPLRRRRADAQWGRPPGRPGPSG